MSIAAVTFHGGRRGIQVEIAAEDGLADLVASGGDAGIRYDEPPERDKIVVR